MGPNEGGSRRTHGVFTLGPEYRLRKDGCVNDCCEQNQKVDSSHVAGCC